MKCSKILAAALILATSATAGAKTFGELNIANHLGVSVHAATTGFGFEVATPVTNYVALRAGASFMPGFSFTTNIDGQYNTDLPDGTTSKGDFNMDVKASLKRTQGSVIFNVYPLGTHSSFFIAAGGYFGGAALATLTGHSEELKQLPAHNHPYIEVGDYKLPVDANGNVDGSLRAKKFRPYLGLGFGRPVPKGRLNFGCEIGVQFMGKMKVYNGNHELEQDKLLGNDDDWQKWMDKLTVYPVLKFTLSGRIF